MTKNLLLSLFLSFLFSCPSNAESLAEIEYLPEQTQAIEKIDMEVEAVSKDEIKITLHGHNFSKPILGFAFNLNFDPDIIQYNYFRKGEFLEQGGDPIYLITTNEKNQGQLISGIILKRGDELPTGSGKIADLFFKILNSGETNLYFDKTVVSTLEEKRENLENIMWSGGVLKTNLPSSKKEAQTSTFNIEPYLNGLLIIVIVLCLFYILYKSLNLYREKRFNKF